jgi:hypothetical protein
MTAEASDGYYWRFHFKLTDKAGNTLIATDRSSPIVARDDLGATSFILSNDLYHFFGEPESIHAEGQGFGHKILHYKLSVRTTSQFDFWYKLDGLDMEWEKFVPLFFPEPESNDPRDLSRLSTFGWKSQAALKNSGIGFVHFGRERYIVSGGEAAQKVAQYLWKK